MNIKKRVSAFTMAALVMATSIPVSVSAENYIQPTKRPPDIAKQCENVVLSSHAVDFYLNDKGQLISQGDAVAFGVPIKGNPKWAEPGADVVRQYTKMPDGSVKIDACSNIKVTDTYVKDSDTFDVAATGLEARNETANFPRMTKREDQTAYKIKDTNKNIIPDTKVKTITKPQNGRGPMSTMNIPKDRVRVCSETKVNRNDISGVSDDTQFLSYLSQKGIKNVNNISDAALRKEFISFQYDVKNIPNSQTVIKKAQELNVDAYRKRLKEVASGDNKGKRGQNIDVALSMNCPDDPGKGGIPNKDPGKKNPNDPNNPPSDNSTPGPKDCLDPGRKSEIQQDAHNRVCVNTCSGGEIRGYTSDSVAGTPIIGETILGQYRQDYKSTTKYKTFAYCPNIDNTGWKFWNESPFSNSLGDIDQTNNYLDYMSGDKKDWKAMNNAWKTRFETRGIADLPNDDLTGKELANWLDGHGSYIMSGLPTYHGDTYVTEFEQITPGVNPPSKQPDSMNLPNHPGMSPLEHGWWQGYSSDGKFDIDKYHNDTEAPIAIEVTEDDAVRSHLGTTKFSDQPIGRFKLAWIDQYMGYKRDGAPVWNKGSNITRRCQQEFQALVKYPREHYKNIIKNGWSMMRVYHPYGWDVCKRTDRRGRCIEYCHTCSIRQVATYTVDCYAFKSCQNEKPGDGVSPTALQVAYDRPGLTWESANAAMAKYMRGDDRPGTNMINRNPSYPGIVYKYGIEPCNLEYTVDAKYNPGRSWNYRDKVMTEYHGYLIPPTVPDGGNPDPRFPGIPQTPKDVTPNDPGSGDNPPGNTLIPFIGKDKGKPDGGNPGGNPGGGNPGGGNPDRRNENNYIKSGYGVTYEAGVKFYSDYGRDNENVVAKFLGSRKDKQPGQGSMLYRPRRTDNIPINKDSSAFSKVIGSIIKNNPDVPTTNARGLLRPTESSAEGAKQLYIWDHAVRTRYKNERYIPYANSVIEANGSGGLDIPGIEGKEHSWKQKSGLGVTYGTDLGYFHADPKTKLYRHLIPGLDESRQHFIHLDYPNGTYSIGSIAQIGMFKNGQETFRTKMGNYANIEVRGNMYEDSYTAPDNPYLNKEDVGGKNKVNYNWNK